MKGLYGIKKAGCVSGLILFEYGHVGSEEGRRRERGIHSDQPEPVLKGIRIDSAEGFGGSVVFIYYMLYFWKNGL